MLPNKNFTKNILSTRAEGRLQNCVAYRTLPYAWWKHQTRVEILDNKTTTEADLQQILSIYNTGT